MRKASILLIGVAPLLLTACGTVSMFGKRNRPDEMAVARNAPLVVPPDFALVPPAPGTTSPVVSDSRAQALEALFGQPSARSASENTVLDQAGRDRAAAAARSVAGDPNTLVVDKGTTTQTILAVPEGDGQEARVNAPQAQPQPAPAQPKGE